MPTIAHITRKLIEKRPFLEEALADGIINNAALAEKMIPEIEKELKKDVKFSAVNLAIRRLAEGMDTKPIINLKFNKDTDITIKSNIIEIVLYKNEKITDVIKKIYNIVDLKKGDFLTITQGINEVMIITNSKNEKKITSLLPKKIIKKKIKKLSTLTINIPESAVNEMGLFYTLSRHLNWENINIVDIVSTYTEMIFIVEEDDASKAFDVLKKLIKRN